MMREPDVVTVFERVTRVERVVMAPDGHVHARPIGTHQNIPGVLVPGKSIGILFDPQAFEANARRRVALGLIINELKVKEKLNPKPAEVRALIEAESQSYEHPAEVVRWFYMQPQRLSEMEGLALESNVVSWVLSKAKVEDKSMLFDELMGGAA